MNKIARAAAHGFDSQPNGAPSRHHDYRKNGIDRLNPREQIEALLTGSCIASVVQIDQDHVEVASFKRGDGRRERCDRFDLISFAFQQQPHGFKNISLVVRDKNSRG